MRLALLLLALAVLPVGCAADSARSTMTLADGRVYPVTDCPASANLLIGGEDAADALPVRGQTDRARVEEELDAVRKHLIGSNGVVAVEVVPRNGEVWFRLPNGDHAVELVDDYQYEVLLSADGICPSAPYSINGVPVLYNRAEG